VTWIEDLVQHANSRIPDRVLESLYGRGVTDAQIELFKIGYLKSPPSVDSPADFQRWVQRIEDCYMLPLTNVLGEVKGLQFRKVERSIRGYDTWLIDDGEPVLFGLGQAAPHIWERGEALLVEGAFDLFPVQRAVPYAFATLTAWVGSSVVRLLRRLVHRIWLGYDMDSTGHRACENFLADHPEFDVRLVVYPRAKLANGDPAKDPADYWEAWGDAKLADFLKTSLDS
jgi:DNA primase